MTAIVLSFPKDRIMRNRFAQVEARKAYQIVRRRDPKLDPGELWQRTLSALQLAARPRTFAIAPSGDLQDRQCGNRTARVERVLASPSALAKLEAALVRLDRIEEERRLMAKLGIDGPPPSAA